MEDNIFDLYHLSVGRRITRSTIYLAFKHQHEQIQKHAAKRKLEKQLSNIDKFCAQRKQNALQKCSKIVTQACCSRFKTCESIIKTSTVIYTINSRGARAYKYPVPKQKGCSICSGKKTCRRCGFKLP